MSTSSPRPGGVERFLGRAAAAGLTPQVREFPAGTRTAADAAAAIGCDVAAIVKSLVFVADDRAVLVLTSGANRVDESAVADQLGHDTDLLVVCDRDLTHLAEVWAAAGSPTTVFPLPPDELLRVTGARVVDVRT